MYMYLMDEVRLASRCGAARQSPAARLASQLHCLGTPLHGNITMSFGKVYACDMSSAGSNAGTTSHYEGQAVV